MNEGLIQDIVNEWMLEVSNRLGIDMVVQILHFAGKVPIRMFIPGGKRVTITYTSLVEAQAEGISPVEILIRLMEHVYQSEPVDRTQFSQRLAYLAGLKLNLPIRAVTYFTSEKGEEMIRFSSPSTAKSLHVPHEDIKRMETIQVNSEDVLVAYFVTRLLYPSAELRFSFSSSIETCYQILHQLQMNFRRWRIEG